MKTITIIAMFQARPGKEAELREALLNLTAPTRKETGCLRYDFHQALDDPAKMISYETWRNQADIDAHMRSPHVQALVPRVDELCVAFPQITSWEKISE